MRAAFFFLTTHLTSRTGSHIPPHIPPVSRETGSMGRAIVPIHAKPRFQPATSCSIAEAPTNDAHSLA